MDWKYGENVKIYLNGELLNCLVQKFETSLKKFVTDSLVVFWSVKQPWYLFAMANNILFQKFILYENNIFKHQLMMVCYYRIFFLVTFCIFFFNLYAYQESLH